MSAARKGGRSRRETGLAASLESTPRDPSLDVAGRLKTSSSHSSESATASASVSLRHTQQWQRQDPERARAYFHMYFIIIQLRRWILTGKRVRWDVTDQHRSMPARAQHCRDDRINSLPFDTLCQLQEKLLRERRIVRVDVEGDCLIRPRWGPAYRDERWWLRPEAAPEA